MSFGINKYEKNNGGIIKFFRDVFNPHKLASSAVSGEYNRLAQFSFIDDDSTSSYLKSVYLTGFLPQRPSGLSLPSRSCQPPTVTVSQLVGDNKDELAQHVEQTEAPGCGEDCSYRHSKCHRDIFRVYYNKTSPSRILQEEKRSWRN